MGLFDEISRNVEKASQSGVQIASNLKEGVRLNTKVSEEEKKLRLYMEKLGAAYYQKFRDAPHEELAGLCAGITEALAAIEAAKLEADRLKCAKICPGCGSKNKDEARFCVFCGGSLSPPQKSLCANCGSALKADSKFCTHCGQRVEKPEPAEAAPPARPAARQCGQCGKAYGVDVAFCTDCGVRLGEA